MDISVIKPEATNTKTGIKIGDNEERIMIEFVNLRCPYCKKWFQDSKEYLAQAVAQDRLSRLIKLTDRQKESLQRGNVMHRYVTTDDAQTALVEIEKIFDTQDQWGNLSLEEVAAFAENTLGLTEHNHAEYAQEITQESEAAVIKFVPTILFDGHIFDESISKEELATFVEQ